MYEHIRIKSFVLFLMVHFFSLSTSAYAEEPVRSWIWDTSDPVSTRMADLWLASKIMVSGSKVALFREADGKLEEYWTANNSQTAEVVRQIVSLAPSLLIQVDDGGFVRASAITSADSAARGCVLKIGTAAAGTLTDPAKIQAAAKLLGFAHFPNLGMNRDRCELPDRVSRRLRRPVEA